MRQRQHFAPTIPPATSRLSSDQLFLLDPAPDGVVLVHDTYWGGSEKGPTSGQWYTQMYSPPKARDLVRVVVTARLTPVGTEDPTDGIEPADGATIESTGVELDGAPVFKIVTDDGWQSISWRDPGEGDNDAFRRGWYVEDGQVVADVVLVQCRRAVFPVG